MNKKTLFSIRKLSVGIASVAIGGLLFVSAGHDADAAEYNTNADTNTEATTELLNSHNASVVEEGATNANTDQPATSEDFFPKADVVEEGATNANTDQPATSEDFFPKADVVEEGATNANTDQPATSEDFFPKADVVDEGEGYVDTSKEATPGDFFGQKDDEGKTGAHYVDNTTDETTTHTVVPGETVAEIAKENNTTVDQIVKDNGLVDANHIVPGQELLVNHPVTNTEDLTQTTTHNNNFTTSQDVVDNKELPETGSESNVNSGLLGGLALAAGAVLVGFNRRKEEK